MLDVLEERSVVSTTTVTKSMWKVDVYNDRIDRMKSNRENQSSKRKRPKPESQKNWGKNAKKNSAKFFSQRYMGQTGVYGQTLEYEKKPDCLVRIRRVRADVGM
jgi:hypothetical protein